MSGLDVKITGFRYDDYDKMAIVKAEISLICARNGLHFNMEENYD